MLRYEPRQNAAHILHYDHEPIYRHWSVCPCLLSWLNCEVNKRATFSRRAAFKKQICGKILVDYWAKPEQTTIVSIPSLLHHLNLQTWKLNTSEVLHTKLTHKVKSFDILAAGRHVRWPWVIQVSWRGQQLSSSGNVHVLSLLPGYLSMHIKSIFSPANRNKYSAIWLAIDMLQVQSSWVKQNQQKRQEKKVTVSIWL